uniref:cilia- and flagella-associated protein 337-like n=1 Tax=Myxine glutinosa TaxID=7769 RepID=UPI00358F8048
MVFWVFRGLLCHLCLFGYFGSSGLSRDIQGSLLCHLCLFGVFVVFRSYGSHGSYGSLGSYWYFGSLGCFGCAAGVLKGHRAPICYVTICQDRGQIFSVDAKSCVKVWNVGAQTCIGSVSGQCNGLVGIVTTCAYLPTMQSLCICANSPVLLAIQNRSSVCGPVPTSHMTGVSCIVYNGVFRHIVTCSLDSIVKVWDLETGRSLFKFVAMNSDSTITCVALDNNGRRLITGSGDGFLKIWNYNIGQCLCSLQQKKGRGEYGCVSEGRRNEAIRDCTYLEINKKGCVISVGCDRRIHRFVDCPDTICPQPLWAADLLHGHRDDVIVLAHCPPDLLASGACDGEIIVWNFISGHVVCRLHTSHAEDASSSQSGEDISVRTMVFLKSRMRDQSTAGVLLASSQDRIRIWNISEGGRLFADFQVGSKKKYITCLGVTSDDHTIFAANVAGSMYSWNIMGYAYEGPESNPPEDVTHWRAHLASITSLVVISEYNLVSTTSLDCNVRLWSTSGELVGTFGQVKLWDISSKNTWQNPSPPKDIQVPQNLCHNPPFTAEADDVFLSRKDGGENEVREDMVKHEDRMEVPQLTLQDENVAQGIRQECHANKQITRLGQAREKNFTKSRPINPERVFHHLSCHPLVEVPTAQEVAYHSQCTMGVTQQDGHTDGSLIEPSSWKSAFMGSGRI